MKIRNFKPDDSASLASIFHETVRAVGRKDYSQAQVEVWSPQPVPADKFLARVSDGRYVFVAVSENDKPIAFIELEENGHIDCFYCHPDAVGTGVGTALFERLESAALAAGLSRLYVEASEAACRFFLGKGFSLIKRRDFERNNVQIHNYLMEKNFR
ncbi:MAG: GNAT family N-acetyltransferase [Rhodobacteraceae bacterium]|nr:MAG: GNAT family N-acetyltransferase [Paracoccaceae bacterium]